MDLKNLSQKQTAEAFGVNRKTIKRWHDSGMPMNRDKTFNLSLCFDWKISQLEGDIGDTRPADMDAEASLKALAEYRQERAKITKLERQILEKEYVLVEKVRADLFTAGSMVKSSLYSLPERFGPILAAESDSFTIKRLMRHEINIILDQLVEDLGKIP
jgi:phage terminase Nu1 subunit (DNA packaging protein)